METFEGRVAVVTGAASGMGLAFARRFASEGMRVVLADVETKALDPAVASILEAGGQAIGVATDVSQPEAVEALAERAYSEFGAVHVLCNNAGVMADGDLGDVAGGGEGGVVPHTDDSTDSRDASVVRESVESSVRRLH